MSSTGEPTSNVDLGGILRIDEFEALAKERLDPAAYAYYAGGAADEITIDRNRAGFERRVLLPRVLVDVSALDASTTMLGTTVTMPVGIAPNAAQGLADPEGECATARAATEAGVIMCVSTFASRPMEDVAAASTGPKWFQLYIHKDRGVAKDMIERAVASGYDAIVLTVDLPVGGYRERELRTPFRTAQVQAFPNLPVDTKGKSILELLDGLINSTLTWDDIDWVRSVAGIPIVIKGVLAPDDAARCAEHGADAITVSNHGGRQLDRTPATIDVLEDIVGSAGSCEVYLDGGVRRGTDVVTALALGARAVFIGRPYLYALATAGQKGVEACLSLLGAEVLNAMALLGAPTIADIKRDHVRGD
ncbi:MAG: 4-hydroxymandelate oxidase [Actinomycetota bacterium]|jgi:isopentenyl diphosphate isomerase/L-lactate dehydrogenase-like FMN-dependent dehydrogenase|nr:4-hydroxymandelate oxidase [Actinomycetota bacterium]